MRALVTGAGGFLGRYLTEQLLERGVQVRTFSRGDYPELRAIGAETVRGHLQDAKAVEAACSGRDVVYHTAAIAGIWGTWKDFYSINTAGTQHVLAGCRQQGVGKLIYTSSPSVTFDGEHQRGIDETAPYAHRWLCHYPHTKALAEQEVLAANSPQLMTCALRPHLIWGPRDPHLIPRLLDRAQKGQLRRVGDGTNLVDIVYVENAAQAHWQAADAMQDPSSRVCGRAYFISQGEPVNCWNWINDVLKLANLPPVTRSIGYDAAWRIGAALETVYTVLRLKGEPRMTRFLAAQLGKSHYFKISTARNDFGYEPTISTADGMQRLANSWANG